VVVAVLTTIPGATNPLAPICGRTTASRQWISGTVSVAVLNQNAHWNWYRGELAAALRCAEQAVELADATDQQKQRVDRVRNRD
jgi:hypothetical protein